MKNCLFLGTKGLCLRHSVWTPRARFVKDPFGLHQVQDSFTCQSATWRKDLLLSSLREGHQRCRAGHTEHVGSLDASSLKIGVVVGRFNDLITKLLLEGALDALKRHGGADSEIVWVPGSFEIPLVAKALAKSGKFDAVLTIGAVVRGATTHYEAVVNSATSGSLGASLESGVPVIFGVLTTETMEQALDRAGGKAGNKGFECAVTAIEMANLLKTLRSNGLAADAWGTEQ